MKQKINHADINAFLTLVESGSFTLAADALQCSRSHVSKQLAQLERQLATSLLVRTTRSQQLTAAGQAFYEQCKQAFQSIDQAIEQAMESNTSLSGSIKINCVGGFIGENVIGPLVTDFMLAHPGVNVSLDFSSKRVDLITGEYDFVFRMGNLTDSNLIARKLTELTVQILASPSYLAKFGYPSHPQQLHQHKCISGSMRAWTLIDDQGAPVEVNVKGELDCRNGKVMLYSALAGNGIVRVPEIYCLNEIAQGELVPVFTDWHIEPTPLYLVYVKDKHQPSRISAFRDHVITHFERYLPILNSNKNNQ